MIHKTEVIDEIVKRGPQKTYRLNCTQYEGNVEFQYFGVRELEDGARCPIVACRNARKKKCELPCNLNHTEHPPESLNIDYTSILKNEIRKDFPDDFEKS